MTRDDEVFGDALELPAAERAAFLDRACAGEDSMRARVETLLALHDANENPDFLNVPLAPRGAVVGEEKPGDLIGRYKLLQKIGEGGCGTVYMAEQREPVRRRVALKVIKLGMDTKAVIARFGAEQQALAMMDHPHVAKVLDGGATETGRPYFVMELVRGVPITKYCDEQLLSTAARLELFSQVCSAIAHAHENGIIHRDIKPSNILVTLQDGVAVPKVIDFGIAKATQGRLTDATYFTAFEQFMGTPAYMSPEQAEISGTEIDPRSDIYSLGVLLYELLTGRTPFETKQLLQAGLDEMRRQIREVDPPRPSLRLRTLEKDNLTAAAQSRRTDPPKLIHLIHGDLDWIVMRCLEKSRARRYETTKDLADDIGRHLKDLPVAARPPSLGYRLIKAIRRHKTGIGVTAVVLVAAVGWMLEHRNSNTIRAFESAPPASGTLLAAGGKSIALLPFANLSVEPDSKYFSDGIHDAILTNLLSIRELRVISSTSMQQYRDTAKPIAQIGRELNVAYILEGKVLRTAAKASVTVRLYQAANEGFVWGKTYERDITDLFAIQNALATEIAGLLRLALSPEEKSRLERRPTENLAAYDLYLRARELSNQEDNISSEGARQRESFYRDAVALDPNFAVAWGELAFLHSFSIYANIDHSAARLALADAAIERAISLAPDTPEVILAQGNYLYHAYRDNARAAELFEKVIELQPSNADAYYFLALVQRSQARHAESLDNLRKATAFAPGSARNWREVTRTLTAFRRWDEAMVAQRRVNALQSNQIKAQAFYMQLTYWATGVTKEADDWLAGLTPDQFASPAVVTERKFWAVVKGDYTEWKRLEKIQPYSGRTEAIESAMVLATLGDVAMARARVAEFPAKIRSDLKLQPASDRLWLALGRIEALLGEKEAALDDARRAADLVPESRDMFTAPLASRNLAVVYAWTGDKERAIDELTRLLRLPFGMIGGVHAIRSDPAYSPLRGNPRFEALLDDPKNHQPLL